MKYILYIICLLNVFISLARADSTAISYEKGEYYLKNNQPDSAAYVFTNFIEQQVEKGKGAFASFVVGKLYRSLSLFRGANTYLNQALIYNDTLTNTILYSDIRNEIGLLYYDQHHYANALSEFSHNIELCSQLKDTFGLAIAYINIGNVYKETDNLQDALMYYEKGLDYAQSKNDTILSGLALTNLGSIHFLQHEPKKAVQFFEQALNLSNASLNSTNLAHIQVNMGLCKVDLEKYTSAKELFETSLDNYKVSDNIEGIYLCYINLYNVSNILNLKKESDYYK